MPVSVKWIQTVCHIHIFNKFIRSSCPNCLISPLQSQALHALGRNSRSLPPFSKGARRAIADTAYAVCFHVEGFRLPFKVLKIEHVVHIVAISAVLLPAFPARGTRLPNSAHFFCHRTANLLYWILTCLSHGCQLKAADLIEATCKTVENRSGKAWKKRAISLRHKPHSTLEITLSNGRWTGWTPWPWYTSRCLAKQNLQGFKLKPWTVATCCQQPGPKASICSLSGLIGKDGKTSRQNEWSQASIPVRKFV